MSVAFEKEIFSNGRLKLFVNYTGINPNNMTDKKALSLSVYAIDTKTYKHIFSESLSYDEIFALYNHLNSVSIVRDSSAVGTGEFVEVTKDLKEKLNVLQTVDSVLVKSLLDKAGDSEKLKLILDALTDSEIEHLHASIKQKTHHTALANLKHLLELEKTSTVTETIKEHQHLAEYKAGQPEKIFQNWIERNTWTLGVEYIAKHSARQISISSESDMIMETTDGFIDLIELKRPKFELFSFDESHKSYYPSKELSKVIGQCLNYLKILDDYKLVLEKQYKFKLLRPRVKIIAGRSDEFSDGQFEALRMFNSSLNHIQIISYDYLVNCGENIVKYYEKPPMATGKIVASEVVEVVIAEPKKAEG